LNIERRCLSKVTGAVTDSDTEGGTDGLVDNPC